MRNIVMWLSIVLLFAVAVGYSGVITVSISSLVVGFISSVLILSATALSFSNMVKRRVANEDIALAEERDTIDKIEDPYDFYSESDNQELSLKEQKKLQKSQKISFIDSLKSSSASLSLYRVFAYALMIIGFFYLRDNYLFNPFSYIAGITLPILVVTTVLFGKGRYNS